MDSEIGVGGRHWICCIGTVHARARPLGERDTVQATAIHACTCKGPCMAVHATVHATRAAVLNDQPNHNPAEGAWPLPAGGTRAVARMPRKWGRALGRLLPRAESCADVRLADGSSDKAAGSPQQLVLWRSPHAARATAGVSAAHRGNQEPCGH